MTDVLKNTTKTNIRNYETLLGEFVDYCIQNEVVNVENNPKWNHGFNAGAK